MARTPTQHPRRIPPQEAAVPLPPLPAVDSVYLTNMRALYEHHPRLAQKIDLIDDADLVPIEPARRQGITCQRPGPKGEPVYLHSRYDPLREADTWAEAVCQTAETQADQAEPDAPTDTSRTITTGEPMCYLVDGFGLGYHVHALFQRLTGDAFLVVSEPDVAMLRSTLEQIDYSELFASGQLIILTTADRDEIFRRLETRSHAMMLGVLYTPPLSRVNADFYTRIHKIINEYVAYVRTTLITILTNSVRTCTNILHSLPTYVATESISVLHNRFAGKPAVVVSAGPSLKKNLPLLKQYRDQLVIVAVQTTLKPLLASGIVPDFVTSLDYHEISRGFFEDVEGLEDIHLVAEPKAHWSVIDTYRDQGPISLLGNEFARLILREWDDPHDNLTPGCTVAHLAFYLAQYLGADPILFVGQDLGFTNNVYYSPGTALHATWRAELGRFCTIEMKEWERILRHRKMLHRVQDIHGRAMYTDEQMFTYLQQFEKDFAACPATVIDATEGGVVKQGCTIMPFAEAMERYGKGPIDPALYDYRRKISRFRADRLPGARELVEKRLQEVRELGEIGQETVELVREMLDLVDDQPELNKRMGRLDELRAKVRQRSSTYRLVCYVSQMAEMVRFRQDQNIKRGALAGKARQRQQLRRDIQYVSEINAGCERLAGMLEACLDRFDEAMDIYNVKPLESKKL